MLLSDPHISDLAHYVTVSLQAFACFCLDIFYFSSALSDIYALFVSVIVACIQTVANGCVCWLFYHGLSLNDENHKSKRKFSDTHIITCLKHILYFVRASQRPEKSIMAVK